MLQPSPRISRSLGRRVDHFLLLGHISSIHCSHVISVHGLEIERNPIRLLLRGWGIVDQIRLGHYSFRMGCVLLQPNRFVQVLIDIKPAPCLFPRPLQIDRLAHHRLQPFHMRLQPPHQLSAHVACGHGLPQVHPRALPVHPRHLSNACRRILSGPALLGRVDLCQF